MIKVAIFTEGQSELIFTREFLHRIFQYEQVHIKCLYLNASREEPVPYEISYPDPKCYIQICNVGNDASVISYMIRSYQTLKNANFKIIAGLRDIFSDEYKKKADMIDNEIIMQFINTQNATLQKITNDKDINILHSIMEFESWLLSFKNLFEKFDPKLTDNFIYEQLNIDFENTCPDDVFYHPTNEVDKILKLAEKKYNKSMKQINSFVNHIISLQDASKFDVINTSSTSLKKYHSFLVEIYKSSIAE